MLNRLQVHVRRPCPKCKGTGSNELTREQAQREVDRYPAGGIVLLGDAPVMNNAQRVALAMQCVDCHGSKWREFWTDLDIQITDQERDDG